MTPPAPYEGGVTFQFGDTPKLALLATSKTVQACSAPLPRPR
ncbi:hypothetical protein J2732_003774 [Achromobacter deleyi]|nr:hypothetical protein [Achromobacter deleyi]